MLRQTVAGIFYFVFYLPLLIQKHIAGLIQDLDRIDWKVLAHVDGSMMYMYSYGLFCW